MKSFDFTLTLRDTDAAGVAFFAAYFSLAHEAYERALAACGAPLHTWLDELHLPIVHAEADYSAPMRLGDQLTLHVGYAKLGKRSFEICTTFTHTTPHASHAVASEVGTVQEDAVQEGTIQLSEGQAARVKLATVKTVHVAVVDGRSSPLPPRLIQALEALGPHAE